MLARARKTVRKRPGKRLKRARPRTAGRIGRVLLLVGTRKGAFLFHAGPDRRSWRLDGPHYLGSIVHHLLLDPRDRRSILMAAKTGHLGPTVFRSSNRGRTWKEATRPPAFPKSGGGTGRAVEAVFWLTPGLPDEPGVWWAGTTPHGLFRSVDGGATWDAVEGFNRHPLGLPWDDHHFSATPGGQLTHSILVDPRDARHIYVGLSAGGVFESRDTGASWRPLNRGLVADFLPDIDPEFGHDPHRVVLHPLRPDRLYQANHCGTYRLDRPGDRWERIGTNMPKAVGDVGFPIATHPHDPDVAWIFPMDGTSVWPRTSPGGRPAVFRTRDAGRTWQRQDRGLPRHDAWFTVKRQAFDVDASSPAGLYFGTTGGELWGSTDEGRSWRLIAAHLPEIYSVTTAMVDR